MKRLMPLLLFALFILPSAPAYAAGEDGFAVESAAITLYEDGYAHVSVRIQVNETLPEATLPLPSNVTMNLLVLDENNTLLDYEVQDGKITIFTLGAAGASLEYDTPSLLSYESGVWTFKANMTFNWMVWLPENAEVVYLSGVPDGIDVQDGVIAISIPAGAWEISYVIPPATPASFEIVSFNVDRASVKAGGWVNVTVHVRNVGDLEGSYTIHLRANGTVIDERTVTLAGGGEATVTFQLKPTRPGSLILEADGHAATLRVEEIGEEASVEEEAPPETGETSSAAQPGISTEHLAALVLAAAGSAAALILWRGRKPNVERMMKDAYLRDEEKKVLGFLAGRGGRAFESEIRKQFPEIPRTSLWRLIRRLERNGMVSVRRVGGVNLVELK